MPNSSYEIIATEYYDLKHQTSRNFDRATLAAFRKKPFPCPSGMVLEVGAGRGRAGEYLSVEHSRIVQLDSSPAMFSLGDREKCCLKVVADACKIPLASQQFSYVVGFLVDPFMGLDFLGEAYRMLEPEGQLLFTVPTQTWGDTLRAQQQIDKRTTRFKVHATGNTLLLPSVLDSEEQLREMLQISGFREITINAHPLAEDDRSISPDIIAAAKALHIAIRDLEIINLVTARR